MGVPAVYALKYWVTLSLFACTIISTDAQQPTQISSSIVIYLLKDLTPNGDTSACQQTVQNALKYNQSSIMFVPTAYWLDQGTNETDPQGKVDLFCLDASADGTSFCGEATLSQIDAFTFGMAACFKPAVEAGLDIVVNPKMLPGNPAKSSSWANGVPFDPLARYGTWSYAEFFLYPLADALAMVISPTTRVRFNLQGQMSASVVYNPQSQKLLLTLLKDRVLRSTNFPRSNIQVGISMHFNKICYCALVEEQDLTFYLEQLPAALETLNYPFDRPAILDLFEATEYIGVTSYPILKPGFSTEELETATEQFSEEMSLFGVNITDLNIRQGKLLFWDEFGVGGSNGSSPAKTAEEAALTPYFAVYGDYQRNTDPWAAQKGSNQATGVQNYRRYFYQQAIVYANQSRQNSRFRYDVAGIYLQSIDSWDVEGISLSSYLNNSYAANESYKDVDIAEAINQYNIQAMAATVSPPAGNN